MQEILMAKAKCCQEFTQTLIDSKGKRLVEAVSSDRFWSCGLNPKDANTTKSSYYPGENHLGHMLESLRDYLIAKLDRSSLTTQNVCADVHPVPPHLTHPQEPTAEQSAPSDVISTESDSISIVNNNDICPIINIHKVQKTFSNPDHPVSDSDYTDDNSEADDRNPVSPPREKHMRVKLIRKKKRKLQIIKGKSKSASSIPTSAARISPMLDWIKRKRSPENNSDSMKKVKHQSPEFTKA